MKKQIYRSFLMNGIFNKRIWMLIAFVLLFSNLVLSFKIASMTVAEKTIIHPISLTEQYSIKGDDIDPLYIGGLAKEFLNARFLYTPKTVIKQFDNLAKHFHPEIYGEKRAELINESEQIVRNDETSVFFPLSTHIKQTTAFVKGELVSYMGKKMIDKKIITYKVDFRNTGGRIWIFDWSVVEFDPMKNSYKELNESVNKGDR